MKRLLLLLPFIIFSCRSVKNSTSNTVVVKDTIRLTTTNTIIKPISDTITIFEPCDTLGQLSSFKYNLTIPNGFVSLSSENNQIKYIVKTKEVVHTDTILVKVKDTSNIQTELKETIKYRIPNWIIWIVSIETLIIIAYISWKKLI